MQEVAQVEAGVVVEDVLQLGVCEDTEDLVVGVHQLQSQLGREGGGDVHVHVHVHCTLHMYMYMCTYIYMYMCKETLRHINVHMHLLAVA